MLNHHDKPEQARVPLDTPATWSSSWTGPQTSLLRWLRLEQCTTSPRWCLLIQDVKPQLCTQKSSAGSYRAHVRAFASYDRVPHLEEHLGCFLDKDEDVGVSFKLFNSTMFSEDAEIIACWQKSRRMSRLPS